MLHNPAAGRMNPATEHSIKEACVIWYEHENGRGTAEKTSPRRLIFLRPGNHKGEPLCFQHKAHPLVHPGTSILSQRVAVPIIGWDAKVS